MAFKQITKYKRTGMPKKIEVPVKAVVEPEEKPKNKNKSSKNNKEMNEQVTKAEEIMNNMKASGNVKYVKKDRGLIERTESSKIVLTEDNRQVLND